MIGRCFGRAAGIQMRLRGGWSMKRQMGRHDVAGLMMPVKTERGKQAREFDKRRQRHAAAEEKHRKHRKNPAYAY